MRLEHGGKDEVITVETFKKSNTVNKIKVKFFAKTMLYLYVSSIKQKL